MAALKRRHGVISKGSKWPVLVEECINDVLIVCLEAGSTTYRGILLDANKRNIPHGICHPFSDKGPGGKSRKTSPLSNGVEHEEPQYESAATILRHSYNQSHTHHTEHKTRNQNQVALTKTLKDKPVSKIKLRPRQMLCSNCKASCYETDKGIVTMTGAPKQNAGKPNDTSSTSGKAEMRSKRHLARDAKSSVRNVKAVAPNVRTTLNSSGNKPSAAVKPVVNLSSIKTEASIRSCSVSINGKAALTKPSSSLMVTSSPSKTSTVNVNSSKSTTINVNTVKTSTVNVSTSKSSTVNVNTSKTSTVNVNAVKSSTINLSTRASPFIKISIGEGTVVQIPPRIHGDEVDGGASGEGEGGDTSQAEDTNLSAGEDSDDSTSQRRVRKLMKRSKEREKSREDFLDIVEKSVEIESDQGVMITSHHKKHKRKHKHKHWDEEVDDLTNRDSSLEGCDEENIDLSQGDILSPNQRPRLLYTWRQNKGLSPRRDISTIRTLSPRRDNINSVQCNNEIFVKKEEETILDIASQNSGVQKEYKLRSREKSQSIESLTEDKSCSGEDSSNSFLSDHNSGENRDKINDESFDIQSCESSGEDDDVEEGPPNDSNFDVFRPLMMKIQTREVNKCVTSDGRRIHVGDIVWGKIQGFPWWPGRVLSISISQRDNDIVLRQLAHVSWFGSSTMSHIQCSDLYPFIENFKVRYNKKKKGPYKTAIKQATIAAQSVTNTHQIDFAELDV